MEFFSYQLNSLTLNFNAHEKTRSSYKEQVEIFFKKTKLINKITNIYAMTDVYYSKFNLDEH